MFRQRGFWPRCHLTDPKASKLFLVGAKQLSKTISPLDREGQNRLVPRVKCEETDPGNDRVEWLIVGQKGETLAADHHRVPNDFTTWRCRLPLDLTDHKANFIHGWSRIGRCEWASRSFWVTYLKMLPAVQTTIHMWSDLFAIIAEQALQK